MAREKEFYSGDINKVEQEFSTIFHPKKINLTITHRQESLCGSPGVKAEKFQHTVGIKNKNPRLEALKRVRRTVYLHHSSPRTANLGAKRALLLP